MKFRDGFVTNSSSTNFLIISKQELTPDYLFDKLGFTRGSLLEPYARELCNDILNATQKDIRRQHSDIIDFDKIAEMFGERSALIYKNKVDKGFHIYTGRTGSDSGQLTSYFTTDYVEIEEEDFYLNGLNCVW